MRHSTWQLEGLEQLKKHVCIIGTTVIIKHGKFKVALSVTWLVEAIWTYLLVYIKSHKRDKLPSIRPEIAHKNGIKND